MRYILANISRMLGIHFSTDKSKSKILKWDTRIEKYVPTLFQWGGGTSYTSWPGTCNKIHGPTPIAISRKLLWLYRFYCNSINCWGKKHNPKCCVQMPSNMYLTGTIFQSNLPYSLVEECDVIVMLLWMIHKNNYWMLWQFPLYTYSGVVLIIFAWWSWRWSVFSTAEQTFLKHSISGAVDQSAIARWINQRYVFIWIHPKPKGRVPQGWWIPGFIFICIFIWSLWDCLSVNPIAILSLTFYRVYVKTDYIQSRRPWRTLTLPRLSFNGMRQNEADIVNSTNISSSFKLYVEWSDTAVGA